MDALGAAAIQPLPRSSPKARALAAFRSRLRVWLVDLGSRLSDSETKVAPELRAAVRRLGQLSSLLSQLVVEDDVARCERLWAEVERLEGKQERYVAVEASMADDRECEVERLTALADGMRLMGVSDPEAAAARVPKPELRPVIAGYMRPPVLSPGMHSLAAALRGKPTPRTMSALRRSSPVFAAVRPREGRARRVGSSSRASPGDPEPPPPPAGAAPDAAELTLIGPTVEAELVRLRRIFDRGEP